MGEMMSQACTGSPTSSACPPFMTTSNGRFSKRPATGLSESWEKDMQQLAERQFRVPEKSAKPVLAIWGANHATEEEIKVLVETTAKFLVEQKPQRLLLSGRRAPDVAEKAKIVLQRALEISEQSGFRPEKFVTGGADGVDGIALRLVHGDDAPFSGIAISGQFTPTPFARADVPDKKNPHPFPKRLEELQLSEFTAGPSPLQAAEEMHMPVPGPGDDFAQFLALMEGQWEARDTNNVEMSDACIAFLTADGRKDHDGTKATLNVIVHGRYAHPLPEHWKAHWETEEERRSPNVIKLSEKDGFVGYKVQPAKAHGSPAN